MSDNAGPVYEVTHTVDLEIAGDLDDWLAEHIDLMLETPGLEDARAYVSDSEDERQARRVTQYFFDNDASLENYLAERAAEMRQSAVERFGESLQVSRRILRGSGIIDAVEADFEHCLNCGTPLGGQYCGKCGQRSRSRLISIWALLQEGQLTKDYLEGRRARFMPPFRTYLVLSILFFVIAFFDPREEFSVFFDEEQVLTEESADTPVSSEILEEMREELAEEGLLDPAPQISGQDDSVEEDAADDEEDSGGFNISFSDDGAAASGECDDIIVENPPPWLESWLTQERLTIICERATEDDGRAFLARLLDATPSALIFLLPLMAFILKVLYPLSKRYYVEHLLFVVHYHAFVFLILTLQTILDRTVAAISLPEAITAVTGTVVFFYVPIYLFKAMRRVYGQGWAMNFLKFVVLLASYSAGLLAIFGITVLYSAFSL
jgi:hypothetical protein